MVPLSRAPSSALPSTSRPDPSSMSSTASHASALSPTSSIHPVALIIVLVLSCAGNIAARPLSTVHAAHPHVRCRGVEDLQCATYALQHQDRARPAHSPDGAGALFGAVGERHGGRS